MNPQPSTSSGASSQEAASSNSDVVPKASMEESAPSTSGSAAAAVQQQQENQVFLNRASLKQCEQLFRSTCRVKLHRCQVATTPAAGNSADVDSDSAEQETVDLTIDEEGEPDGNCSKEDEVQVLQVLPPPPPKVSKKTKSIAKKVVGKKVAYGKLSVPCQVCGKTMSSKLFLQIHMRKHSGEADEKKARNQRDGVCPQEKKNSDEWRPKGAWTCKICAKRMKYPGSYVPHMRSHRGEKPFKCGECGKAFCRNASLSEHNRIHSGVWQFSCLFCDRGFHQQQNMFVHLRIHTEEKPYFCVVEGCGDCFRHIHSLKRHRRLIHLKKY